MFEQAIENRMEEVCSMWDTLKERTNARLEALDRAREIHTFNRNVEETRAWIQEKEAALMFSDDGARDLSSVQALQRKHQGFQVSDVTEFNVRSAILRHSVSLVFQVSVLKPKPR